MGSQFMRWSGYALLVIAGMLNTLAFSPYTLWWMPFITLFIFSLAILKSDSSKQAASYGFCYGLGWFGVGISWVHVSIDQFGGLPLIASLALMALLVSYLAIFPALTAYLSKLAQRTLPFPLVITACWIATEALRSVFLTGFPWLSLGYSQTDTLLRHYAPWIGEVGIAALLVFMAASIAMLWQGTRLLQRCWALALSIGLVLNAIILSQWTGWSYSGQQAKVLLVQGNVQQELRWVPEMEWPTMLKYLDMTRPAFYDHQLIIWPEAAIPRIEPLADSFLENLDRAALYANSAVITGIIDYNLKTQEAWNNLIVVGKQTADAQQGHYFYGHSNRFSKHHLLPIGEFVPFEHFLRQLAPIFDLPMSSFSRGSYVQPNLQANGFFLLPAICFEIAFPQQIRANFTDQTQFILTVSNDAWFGDSIGPHQHLQIARMRALEFGRPVLRATNNGITATIDANGQIKQRAPQFTEALLSDEVALTEGSTLYQHYGNWPVYGFSLFTLFLAALRRKRHQVKLQ